MLQKNNTLLTISKDILLSTAKTCTVFILSQNLMKIQRDLTKDTVENFNQGYRYLKNRYH